MVHSKSRRRTTVSVAARITVLVLCVFGARKCVGTLSLPAEYPQLPHGPPILPPAYRNYFALDGDAESLVRSIAGPGFLPKTFFDYPPFRTTPAPTWTRATTPKDQIVEYLERTVDHLISGGYQPRERLPLLDSNAIEADALLFSTDDKTPQHTASRQKDQSQEDGEEMDGSGEAPAVAEKRPSSIAGIPNVFPKISKVPLDFRALAPTDFTVATGEEADAFMKRLKTRPDVPQGGFGPLAHADERDIRRHPGKTRYASDALGKGGAEDTQIPKSVDQFQYGSKPTYKQGLMSSVLDFLGLPQVGDHTSELDRVITDWLLQHSPTHTTKEQRRANIPSSYNSFQKFITQSMMPLCTPQPESVENFNVRAFMGQWFQVMHSPLMSSSSCSMMSYELLTETPNGVGSIFQTLEYSTPRRDETLRSGATRRMMMSSGHAIVSRPGQLIYRKSNSPDDAIVHVVHVSDSPTVSGRYEYAILSINCNYPLYVIARDPATFEQHYARTVNAFLQRKGLVNSVSQFLNIVKPVDFSQCLLPPTFFDPK